MKKLVGIAVAGAMMAGYQSAQAQAIPSSGNADLWLFVSDQTAKTSFAVDTGVSVSSLLNSFTSNAVLQQVNDSFSETEHQLSSTDALSSYLKTSDTLEWAVVGMNWTGTNTQNAANEKAGATVGLLSSGLSTAGNSIKNMGFTNLYNWASNLNPDMIYVIQGGGYTAGGATYPFSSGSNFGNVWGATQSQAGAGSTNEYAQGPDQANTPVGSSETLYGVTGNNNNGKLQSYLLGTLTLGTDGSLTLTSSPVPLPAAVWLFGSGLLGLAGVGRRRIAVTAVAA